MSRRKLIGAALIAAQLLWFAREQTTRSRYFCWAPLHEHVFYRIEARVGDMRLSERQVRLRYTRPGAHYDRVRNELWELNAAAHVIDSIAWTEALLPKAQRAHVALLYRIDDQEPRKWTYTP